MNIIAALQLEKAASDSVRASVLEALKAYAKATEQPELFDAAVAAMPKAHPWRAPKEWRARYEDIFRCVADEDCGVDPSEASRYCGEYWSALTDEQRQERLADPMKGQDDGRKDAEALNDA